LNIIISDQYIQCSYLLKNINESKARKEKIAIVRRDEQLCGLCHP